MVEYSFPTHKDAQQIGKSQSRLDGPIKSTGNAVYSYDKNLPGMLYAKLLTCPHAHARIQALDTTKAAAIPGVVAIHVIQDQGTEIQWAHDEIVAVAATSEEIARDAVRAVEVEYEVLDHFVTEHEIEQAPFAKDPDEETVGDPSAAFERAAVVVEQELSAEQVAHMCLEAHGQVAQWDGEEFTIYASTQAVSVIPAEFGEALGVKASQVRIRTDYMGGGFGSKFSPDRWGIVGAKLARETGKPVKLFLDRDQEVAVAGSRPSSYAKIRVGADEEGKLIAWHSEAWGSGGLPGTGKTPMPYLFEVPNRHRSHRSVPTHKAGSRAWRAPNHPQACFMTLAMVDEVAAELSLDPVLLIRRNIELMPKKLQATWMEQLDLASEQMNWGARWRPRTVMDEGPDGRPSAIQRGLGVSVHTWGGRGHRSNCEVTVHPDGSVEARIGTQDLGTGTRTVVASVLAETFGLELEDVRVHMGDSRLPQSGASGGSSTVGGVAGATRRAAQDAAQQLFEKVGSSLGVAPQQLEARAAGSG